MTQGLSPDLAEESQIKLPNKYSYSFINAGEITIPQGTLEDSPKFLKKWKITKPTNSEYLVNIFALSELKSLGGVNDFAFVLSQSPDDITYTTVANSDLISSLTFSANHIEPFVAIDQDQYLALGCYGGTDADGVIKLISAVIDIILPPNSTIEELL